MATTNISRRGMKSAPLGNRLHSLGADALAILIGLSIIHTFRFGSDIPLPEVFLTVLAPFLFVMRFRKVMAGRAARILLLVGLWLLWQIATDIYRQTELLDWVKGDALIIFFAIDFLALAALLGYSERRKALFIGSLGIGEILATRFDPSANALIAPWKFGYADGVGLLVAVISCYFYKKRNYAMVGVLLSALALVNLGFYYRSPVLYILVTMALVLPIVPERVGRIQLLPRTGTTARILTLASFALLAAGMASFLVGHLASTGVLGDAAQKKNEEQSQNKFGILLGGRPEILVSSRAVFDSPILGHGSWARDMKYVDMLTDLETKYGMEVDQEEVDANSQGLIPSHSHLMTSWIRSGLFGGVFWIYVFILTVKATVRASMLREALTPLYVLLLLGFAWDILFSPFGASERLFAALALVVIRDLLDPLTGAPAEPERIRLAPSPRGVVRAIPSRRF